MGGGSVTRPTNPGLPSLPRQRLAEQIAEMLRHQIILGDLGPGVPVHERETAEALGVSRTPLREALFILEADGLVRMAPARTPTVADPSFIEISQMLLVQSALEGLAGECACAQISDAEVIEIAALHDRLMALSDSDDALEFFRIDMAFHEAIVASTGNDPLIRTHRQYHIRLWRARYQSSEKRVNRKKTLQDHGRIVEGLRGRDPTIAGGILREHLLRAIQNLSEIYNEPSV